MSNESDNTVPRTQLVDVLQAHINSWNFESAPESENARFVTQLGHWACEKFGQVDDKGTWWLYPKYSYGDGFDHTELPEYMKQIVMTDHYGEMYAGNDNSVRMQTSVQLLENDPFIPKYDEISKLKTFSEQLDAIISDPEVVDNIRPSSFEVIPGIDINFKPATYFKWGMQVAADQTGVWAIPYGEYRHTRIPFEFATELTRHQAQLAKLSAELVFLAAKHATEYPYGFKTSDITQLEARIFGTETIPVDGLDLQPKPGNSVKNLLITKALESKKE